MTPEVNQQVRFKLDGREYTGTVNAVHSTHSDVSFMYKTGKVIMQLSNKKLKTIQP